MAPPKVMNGAKLLIQVDDGTWANFVHYCAINTERGIVFGSSPITELLPDCTNPEDPAWETASAEGLNAVVNGAGILDTASIDFFWTWYKSGSERAVRVGLPGVAAADGGGYWYGNAIITEFAIRAGGNKAKATFDMTMRNSNEWDWQDAA